MENNDINDNPSTINIIRENYKTQFSGKKTCSRCGIQFVIMAGIVALCVLIAYFPEDKRMYGVAFIMAAVSGIIYLIAYWLIIKLYMRQIPQTERLNNADQFSENFRIMESQE